MDQVIKISEIVQLECGGKLGLSQCPGKNLVKGRDGKAHIRDIGSDLANYKERGVNTIVCLLNDSELRSLGVSPQRYQEVASKLEIALIKYPILEMAAPESVESLEINVLGPLAFDLLQGKFVVVHCRGGIGRAGTVAACMLKKLSLFENHLQAIKHVRKKRDKRCVESRKQEDFIRLYFKS